MNIVPDNFDFAAYLAATEHKAAIVHSSAFLDDLKESYRPKDRGQRIYMPWEKTKSLFHFRPGEVSLWAGESGQGKSLVMNQICMSLLGQQQKVCLASLELTAAETFKRLLRIYSHVCFEDEDTSALTEKQLAGLDDAAEQMLGFTQNMWLFHRLGDVAPSLILGSMKYAVDKHGVQHFIIDNLQKCIKGTDDYNAEKDFVASLFDMAKETGCHVHLVHHTKKPSKSGEEPDKSSVKGSSSITDIIDNAFIVWRNLPKEKESEKPRPDQTKMSEPDTFIKCVKQRHYSGSGVGERTFGVWFDRQSSQLKGSPEAELMDFYKAWPHGAGGYGGYGGGEDSF
jgi:twinkle protein